MSLLVCACFYGSVCVFLGILVFFVFVFELTKFFLVACYILNCSHLIGC